MRYLLLIFSFLLILGSCQRKKPQPMQIVFKNPIQDTLVLEPISNLSSPIELDSLLLSTQSANTQEFYELNDYKTAWSDPVNQQELIQSIQQINYDGINPSTFELETLEHYSDNWKQLNDSTKIQADFLFTQSFETLTQKLFNGVLNPRKLYRDWDLEYHEINTAKTLILVLDNNAVNQAFDSIRPKHPQYHRYRAKLKQYYALNKEPISIIDSVLVVDQEYQELAQIKSRLNFIGAFADSLEITPKYDSLFQKQLFAYQTKNKLDPKGHIDSKTWESIEKQTNILVEKLTVNLERFRWFPRHYGKDYILVNIPDFTLVSVANNDTVQKHNVIVGTAARKTPILNSTLTTLVLNPTWTVPPTILKNDIVPKAKRNLGYFASQNFTIYQNSTGKVVSPQDWDASKYNSYRYVQKGGTGNTLGRIKFMFKNNHSVYLHDTPNKSNFNKQFRDMSSGCVRVESPFDLAAFILELQDNHMSSKEIEEIISSQKTTNISVSKKPIGVFLLYWTLNLDQNLKPYPIADIYKYDDNLYSLLKKAK